MNKIKDKAHRTVMAAPCKTKKTPKPKPKPKKK